MEIRFNSHSSCVPICNEVYFCDGNVRYGDDVDELKTAPVSELSVMIDGDTPFVIYWSGKDEEKSVVADGAICFGTGDDGRYCCAFGVGGNLFFLHVDSIVRIVERDPDEEE